MIKKIDLYIIRKFLSTFFLGLILFIMVTVVIDLSENVDDFLEHQVPLAKVMTGYYMNFIPYIILLLSPLFIFISVIFFTAKMAARSEFVAILASGVSFYRILYPYLFAAALLMGMQYYANHYLVPKANKARLEFDRTYMQNSRINKQRNIFMQTDPTTFVTLQTFNPKDSVGTNFVLERVEKSELIYKLKADKITWDKEKEEWKMKKFVSREIDGIQEKLITGEEDSRDLGFTPSDFGRKKKLKETMTTPELNKVINREQEKGASGLEFFLIEKYKRTAIPFATLILTLIGFSIASRKVRGGIGLHILVGITISAAFVVMLQFSTTFSTHANFPPFVAVWLPNIFFGILSFFLMLWAPK